MLDVATLNVIGRRLGTEFRVEPEPDPSADLQRLLDALRLLELREEAETARDVPPGDGRSAVGH